LCLPTSQLTAELTAKRLDERQHRSGLHGRRDVRTGRASLRLAGPSGSEAILARPGRAAASPSSAEVMEADLSARPAGSAAVGLALHQVSAASRDDRRSSEDTRSRSIEASPSCIRPPPSTVRGEAQAQRRTTARPADASPSSIAGVCPACRRASSLAEGEARLATGPATPEPPRPHLRRSSRGTPGRRGTHRSRARSSTAHRRSDPAAPRPIGRPCLAREGSPARPSPGKSAATPGSSPRPRTAPPTVGTPGRVLVVDLARPVLVTGAAVVDVVLQRRPDGLFVHGCHEDSMATLAAQ
jgi:hypothetical protein